MLLTATSTAATMRDLIAPADLIIINANVPAKPFTVYIQNTQAAATLYVTLNFVTATSTTGISLATNDSITFVCSDLASISLISSAATNTVIYVVNQ